MKNSTLHDHLAKLKEERAQATIENDEYRMRLDEIVEALEEQAGFLMYAPGVAGGDKDQAQVRIDELKQLDWRAGMEMQGELYTEVDDAEGAIRVWREIVERYPDDLNAVLALAFRLQRAAKYREADLLFAGLRESEEPGAAQTGEQ